MEEKRPNALEMGKEKAPKAQKEDAEKDWRALELAFPSLTFFIFSIRALASGKDIKGESLI